MANSKIAKFEGGVRVLLRLRDINDMASFQADMALVVRFCGVVKDILFNCGEMSNSIRFLLSKNCDISQLKTLYLEKLQRFHQRLNDVSRAVDLLLQSLKTGDVYEMYRLFTLLDDEARYEVENSKNYINNCASN